MIETIALVFFGVVSIVQLYVIVNLYNKVDFLEQVLDGTYATIQDTINKMKEIGREEVNKYGIYIKFYCTPVDTI